MSRKGRISHDRIEALEKRVAALEAVRSVDLAPALFDRAVKEALRLAGLTKFEEAHETKGDPAHPSSYRPLFDHWPGNER